VGKSFPHTPLRFEPYEKIQGNKAKKACCPETPRVGLEPTSENQQAVNSKTLTENNNPVLSTGLDKTLQKYPELQQIISAWPKLPEHIKATVKDLIQTHKTEKK